MPVQRCVPRGSKIQNQKGAACNRCEQRRQEHADAAMWASASDAGTHVCRRRVWNIVRTNARTESVTTAAWLGDQRQPHASVLVGDRHGIIERPRTDGGVADKEAGVANRTYGTVPRTNRVPQRG